MMIMMSKGCMRRMVDMACGFQPVSNFDLKIKAAVVSNTLGIRGYALQAYKVGNDQPVELFVPEPHIFITIK